MPTTFPQNAAQTGTPLPARTPRLQTGASGPGQGLGSDVAGTAGDVASGPTATASTAAEQTLTRHAETIDSILALLNATITTTAPARAQSSAGMTVTTQQPRVLSSTAGVAAPQTAPPAVGYAFTGCKAGLAVDVASQRFTFVGFDGTTVAYFDPVTYALHTYDITAGNLQSGGNLTVSGAANIVGNINASGGYRYVAFDAQTPATRIPANSSVAAGSTGGKQVRLPYAGSIVAVGISQGDAAVTGTVTAAVVLNGTAQLSASVGMTGTVGNQKTLAVGALTFPANSDLYVSLSTSGYSQAGGNITVQVFVSA